MRETWTFGSAGQIVFGPGAVRQLGELAKRLGLKRILVVTDARLVEAGIYDEVRRPLGEWTTLDVFNGGEPEPSLQVAERCVAHARDFAPDGLIGLGGGSNMDLAKMAAAVLAHGGTPRDYLGEDRIPGPILPLVCVPTTSGTGSEVSAAGVFTDQDNHIKVGAISNYFRPKVALVDPRLTLSCPHKVTADSGIDAMTHAIEAFTAVDNATFPLPPGEVSLFQGRHPLGDCLAEKAISLIGKNLARAVENPDDLAAREGMALGAMLAGLAFSNVGVALVHALEYPIGGATHCSHGAGNGLLLPHVMRYNLPVRQREFARIAQLLGVDTTGRTEREAAVQAVGAIEALNHKIGIPARLRDLGAKQEQIPEFAEKGLAIARIIRVNPRVPKLPEVIKLLNEAY
ncbi:MAG: iron-containing alcohol dehydrogenase [Planctomycetia bacterium]|nr:iron-containing alcohol dehydrogenase [Planctomycetia bacterium]